MTVLAMCLPMICLANGDVISPSLKKAISLQAPRKNPGGWDQHLANAEETNINQYRCDSQASERVLQTTFLACVSGPCPEAAVFYAPNPPLIFSVLAKTRHTSALPLSFFDIHMKQLQPTPCQATPSFICCLSLE